MFYESMILYSQEQFEEYQEAAFALLALETRKSIEIQAERLNSTLPDGSKIKAHQLLIATSPVAGSHVQSTKLLSDTDGKATVELMLETGSISMQLVREDSKWRVDLGSYFDATALKPQLIAP